MTPALPIDIAFHGLPADMPAFARAAEASGTVGGLFAAEAAHDVFVTLTLAATATETLPVGTSIAVAFARTPMAMAYPAYDLQRLSGGRFVLGLGSQVKPHIARRFAMPWSRPAARMEEYIAALRAIWHSWQSGDRLAFRGDFYSHTLMPPMFDPGPLPTDSPDIWLAGVGPRMVETAGAVADGFIGHPLVSRSYLEQELLPALRRGRERSDRERFVVQSMAIVATGRTEEELAVAVEGSRRQLAFYASTPAYRQVLDHHGWGELHEAAHQFTVRNRWDELAGLIDDEVLNTFAVVGDLPTVGAELRDRFGGRADRVVLSIPYRGDDELPLAIADAVGSS